MMGPLNVLKVALLLALSGTYYPGYACQICLPFPKDTVADHLISAKVVAFAREDPAMPFSLSATEVLKGELKENKIDLFLDSQTRRIFSVNADRKLLCVFADKGKNLGWNRVGLTDAAGLYERVVREILQMAEKWEESPQLRQDYFSQYLGHEDVQLRELAHIEVARAPYDRILSVGDRVPVETIRGFLSEVRYFEWHSLYILLLAQSEEEEDRLRIRDSVKSSAKYSTLIHLSAWLTAWIEIDGADALASIQEIYLKNADRSAEELKAVLAALSVHGTNGHTFLQDDIVSGYRSLLEVRPELVQGVVQDLAKWKRWELADLIREIELAEGGKMDLQARLELRAYLKNALSNEPSKGDGKNDGYKRSYSTLLIVGGALVVLPLLLVLGRLNRDR